jgi:hypothetical protein
VPHSSGSGGFFGAVNSMGSFAGRISRPIQAPAQNEPLFGGNRGAQDSFMGLASEAGAGHNSDRGQPNDAFRCSCGSNGGHRTTVAWGGGGCTAPPKGFPGSGFGGYRNGPSGMRRQPGRSSQLGRPRHVQGGPGTVACADPVGASCAHLPLCAKLHRG